MAMYIFIICCIFFGEGRWDTLASPFLGLGTAPTQASGARHRPAPVLCIEYKHIFYVDFSIIYIYIMCDSSLSYKEKKKEMFNALQLIHVHLHLYTSTG